MLALVLVGEEAVAFITPLKVTLVVMMTPIFFIAPVVIFIGEATDAGAGAEPAADAVSVPRPKIASSVNVAAIWPHDHRLDLPHVKPSRIQGLEKVKPRGLEIRGVCAVGFRGNTYTTRDGRGVVIIDGGVVGRNSNMARFPDPSGNGIVGHPAFPTLPKL